MHALRSLYMSDVLQGSSSERFIIRTCMYDDHSACMYSHHSTCTYYDSKAHTMASLPEEQTGLGVVISGLKVCVANIEVGTG